MKENTKAEHNTRVFVHRLIATIEKLLEDLRDTEKQKELSEKYVGVCHYLDCMEAVEIGRLVEIYNNEIKGLFSGSTYTSFIEYDDYLITIPPEMFKAAYEQDETFMGDVLKRRKHFIVWILNTLRDLERFFMGLSSEVNTDVLEWAVSESSSSWRHE